MDNELEEYFETEKQIITVLKDALAKGKPRTVEDFVDDMIHQNKTLSQITVTASCTRWKGQIEKIKEYYHERANRKDKKISR